MSTETKTRRVVTFQVTPRIIVDIPVVEFDAMDLTPDEADARDIIDLLAQDSDTIPDALQAMMERGSFDSRMVDVDLVEEEHEADAPEKVEFYKPREDEFYTLPIPNFISGNVRITDEGLEEVYESPVNKLSDEQLEGAYHAAKRIWGLRGMHRYQQIQIAEFISELQWGMLARPTLHVFKAQADGSIEEPEPACSYCGKLQEGHLVRKESAS